MLKDPRAVLGVGEGAGPEEIRRAYLRQAVKYHPDRNPGDAAAEERFKDLSQAYAILSDPAARAGYERVRAAGGARSSTQASSSSSQARSRTGRPAGRTRPGDPKPGGPRPGGPRPDGSRPNGSKAAGTGAAGTDAAGTEGSRAEGSRAEGSRTEGSARREAGEPDWDETLAAFFRSPKGRAALNDLEGELNKAGLKFSPDDFARWLKTRRRRPSPKPPFAALRPLLGRLWARLAGGEARRPKIAPYDRGYELALSPESAAAGLTVEIAYPRDGQTCRLKAAIPAGVKDGTRLRLAGQGDLKPDNSRGDLELIILVGRRPSAADLWKEY